MQIAQVVLGSCKSSLLPPVLGGSGPKPPKVSSPLQVEAASCPPTMGRWRAGPDLRGNNYTQKLPLLPESSSLTKVQYLYPKHSWMKTITWPSHKDVTQIEIWFYSFEVENVTFFEMDCLDLKHCTSIWHIAAAPACWYIHLPPAELWRDQKTGSQLK